MSRVGTDVHELSGDHIEVSDSIVPFSDHLGTEAWEQDFGGTERQGSSSAGMGGALTNGDVPQLLRPQLYVLEDPGQDGQQKVIRGSILQLQAQLW